MRKRKAEKPPNPTAADMPQNPEFQEFFENLGKVVSIPKADIEVLLAEEQEAREAMRAQRHLSANDHDKCSAEFFTARRALS